ncbi:MAG: glycosyltransferase [Acidobacteriota bacterium]|nr:glycosyltransferase [Acidobacteriota bacterium]
MPFDVSAFLVLVGVAWATTGMWLVGAYLTWTGIRRQRPLMPVDNHELMDAAAPLVSILVPARNEEHRVLEQSIRSMLAQDYGRFEVVAVNDRSTDATGIILRSIALSDQRLRVIDGVEPPAGWLGKPHALQQALDEARGEWVLATDADMIFHPHAVRTAMTHAVRGRYDAVTLLPYVECLSFWEKVFMPAFGWFMIMALPLERVNDPARPESLGVGGFFLIRRAMLEGVGGYRAVRNEVAEDLRTAEILKGAGARLRVEYAPDLARTRMQTNLREIWEGFTKNLFAGAKFSFWRALAGAFSVLLFSVAPALLAVFCALKLLTGVGHGWWQLFIPAALVWVIQVATFALINTSWHIPARYALTMPLGHALFVAILINSAVRIASGSGVTWKGRRLYESAGVRPPRGETAIPNRPVIDE